MTFWSYQKTLIENFLYMAATITWIFLDAMHHYFHDFQVISPTPDRLLYLRLRQAKTFEEWRECARQLDIMLGNDGWRGDVVSGDYDSKLISIRLKHLREARDGGDVCAMIYRLRAGTYSSICLFVCF